MLLAWTIVVAYSFSPFEFAATRGPLSERLPLGLPASPGDLLDLLLHGLLFAAVGVTDRWAVRWSDPGGRTFTPVLVRGVLLCLSIEIGQSLVAARHAAVVDLMVNVLGYSLGHLSGRPLLMHTGLSSHRPTVRSRAAGVGWLTVWGLVWGSLILLPARFVALDRWDPGYHLIIGNESDGQRPWEGEIAYVAVYDRALSADQVRGSLAHPPGLEGSTAARLPMGLLAAYDFTGASERAVAPQGRLRAPGLELLVPPGATWRTGAASSLLIQQGSLLSSAAPAEPLTAAMASANAFTIEVWCRPASLAQTGPARIVSVSEGIEMRNFTVGQEEDAITFRVRNRLNGANGVAFELNAPHTLSRDPVQVLAIYDGGRSLVLRNGERSGTVDLREPSALIGLGTRVAGAAIVALLAALSLIVVRASWLPHLVGACHFLQLLLIGYGILLIPVAFGLFLSFVPPNTVHAWFAPMLLVSWLCCRGRGAEAYAADDAAR
jgi:hypothetical protein